MPKRLTLNQTVEVPVKAEHVPYSRQYHPHGDIAPEPVGPMAKVSSRTRAIMLLEEVIGRPENMLALDKALQAEFEAGPTRFFRTYVMPFIPKHTKLDVKGLPVEIRLVNVTVNQ